MILSCSESETHPFCGKSVDLAPSSRKLLAVAILRSWCAKEMVYSYLGLWPSDCGMYDPVGSERRPMKTLHVLDFVTNSWRSQLFWWMWHAMGQCCETIKRSQRQNIRVSRAIRWLQESCERSYAISPVRRIISEEVKAACRSIAESSQTSQAVVLLSRQAWNLLIQRASDLRRPDP